MQQLFGHYYESIDLQCYAFLQIDRIFLNTPNDFSVDQTSFPFNARKASTQRMRKLIRSDVQQDFLNQLPLLLVSTQISTFQICDSNLRVE